MKYTGTASPVKRDKNVSKAHAQTALELPNNNCNVYADTEIKLALLQKYHVKVGYKAAGLDNLVLFPYC